MSFYRLIFYHAMLGGWAALVGWFISELFFLHRSPNPDFGWNVLAAALVGAAIGGGISLVGVVANGRFRGTELRLAFCLAGGFLGGALGGLIGGLIFRVAQFLVVQAFGWMIMGLGIGGVEGLFDRSSKKIRNGLIGGAIGGFLGGLCLAPAARFGGGDMSARAIAFVILGASIGLFVGLAQIFLREAWLTVEQGFRPGRQFVLNIPTTILGTSEKSQLPFIAFGAKGVEPIHVRIQRQNDGTYLLVDNGTRTGTFVNGQRVTETVLENDDLIQLGPNTVRFREVVRHVTSEQEAKRKLPPPVPASLPEAVPILTPAPSPAMTVKPPPPKPSAAVTAAPPMPKPKPPPVPMSAAAQTIKPAPAVVAPAPAAATAPRGKPCPKCGKPGTPVPGTGNHLCMGCDLKY